MVKRIGTRLLCLSVLLALVSIPFVSQNVSASSPDVTAVKQEHGDAFSEMRLCPGGDVFGMRIFMPGVMIVNLGEVTNGATHAKPAEEGGLAVKDMITHIDSKEIHHAKAVTDAIENSEGKPLKITVERDGKPLTLTVTPVMSEKDGKYRIGIWVRDRTAGIGTVTFIDPQTGIFGGLGHGICDPETGDVIPLSRGIVTDARIMGISKGSVGAPGELRGSLGLKKRGSLTHNSPAGVFGVLADRTVVNAEDALPLARKNEVKLGKAEIYCTLADGDKKHYAIEITKIHPSNRETKCFSIRVTDKMLLDTAGGIVQGMSGSPIIQNGKLIGAVTHVLINDPTTGYGIFIENMLSAVQTPLARAS